MSDFEEIIDEMFECISNGSDTWGYTGYFAERIEAARNDRTCKLEQHGALADQPSMVCWSCSECGFGWHHSINDKQFSYCPNCGRRVES